jgi:DNA-binding FadR family transcriptional regulator
VRRNDRAFLDALGARTIPDPTTAGDFCRRFTPEDVEALQDIFDQTRLKVWRQQPPAFFDEAVLLTPADSTELTAC